MLDSTIRRVSSLSDWGLGTGSDEAPSAVLLRAPLCLLEKELRSAEVGLMKLLSLDIEPCRCSDVVVSCDVAVECRSVGM
jgi:hypothetical protein